MRELARRLARWLIGCHPAAGRTLRVDVDPDEVRVWAAPDLWYDGRHWRQP